MNASSPALSSKAVLAAGQARIYRLETPNTKVEAFIATTPQTREISNNPTMAGLDYTRRLRNACTDILKALAVDVPEDEAVVVNILRGGLNFGLREALGDAFGWNSHTTCFMSAQRARDSKDSEEWHITENSYKKVYFPPSASFFVGDVVATGTSLRYGLQELFNSAAEQKINVRNLVFFTYGGPKALEILKEVDLSCRERFSGFGRTILVYLEGCFTVPAPDTPLHVRLTGTDLVRLGSIMAPEFIESQYESPSYPIERCTIYDAGSRAFWVREYAEDVIGYWRQNLQFANQGMTFETLLAERFPEMSVERFGKVDLKELSLSQIAKMEKFLAGSPAQRARQD